jgi:hypothetical protein
MPRPSTRNSRCRGSGTQEQVPWVHVCNVHGHTNATTHELLVGSGDTLSVLYFVRMRTCGESTMNPRSEWGRLIGGAGAGRPSGLRDPPIATT